MTFRSRHPLLGENVSITVRYGFAIVSNGSGQRAALCLPTVTRHKIVLDYISWHRDESEAMATISAMNLAGITPESVREDMKRDRKRQKASRPAEEPEGGGGSFTAAIRAAAGMDTPRPQLGGPVEVVAGEVVGDG